MISFSSKSDYAIKALVRLALAYGSEPVTAREIVTFTGIPPKFLEQVMHDLRHGGLVESQRGKNGGYVLVRDPTSISFADVIELIDGPRIAKGDGHAAGSGSNGGKGRMPRGDQADALVAPVWRALRECTRAVLSAATIADAAARATAAPMYYI